ncbi:hypothetical protein FKM82_028894 [Ascaphus truei]
MPGGLLSLCALPVHICSVMELFVLSSHAFCSHGSCFKTVTLHLLNERADVSCGASGCRLVTCRLYPALAYRRKHPGRALPLTLGRLGFSEPNTGN